MSTTESDSLILNGGSAFPAGELGKGMNLRDYFAAAALPAALQQHGQPAPAAAAAYDAAEALMAERARRYLPQQMPL